MAADPDVVADPNAVSVYFTDKTVERFAVVVRRPGAEWLAGFKADALAAGAAGGSAVRGEAVKIIEAEDVRRHESGLVTYAAPDADVETALSAAWLADAE